MTINTGLTFNSAALIPQLVNQHVQTHFAHMPETIAMLETPRDPEALGKPQQFLDAVAPVNGTYVDAEFHMRMGHLGTFPSLMRALGFVIDFTFSSSNALPAGLCFRLSGGDSADIDRFPITMLDAGGRFRAALSGPTSHYRGGYLFWDDATYSLEQIDPIAQTTRQSNPKNDQRIITTGLAVHWVNLAPHTNDRVTTAQANQSSLQPIDQSAPVTLFYDDLVRGYRVDVMDVTANQGWKTLCRRSVDYTFPAGPNSSLDFITDDPDEGWMPISGAQQDGDPTSHLVHDALFRWEGHSLIAQRFPDDPQPDLDDGLATAVYADEKSLPALRFGHKYRVRMRVADVAGNGITLKDADESCASPAVSAFLYSRFEYFDAPSFVFDRREERSEKPAVLRLRTDRRGRSYDTTRHLLPPGMGYDMVERHGVLDGWSDEATYALNGRSGVPMPSAFQRGETVPYIPDPCVTGVRVEMLDETGNAFVDDQGNKLQLVQSCAFPGVWPDLGSVPLVISADADNSQPSITSSGGEVCIGLARGRSVELRLTSLVNSPLVQSTLGYLLSPLFPAAVQATILADITAGNSPYAPKAHLTAVHAVQVPSVAPALTADPGNVLQQVAGGTSGTIASQVTLDGAVTGGIELAATWTDVIDDDCDPGQHPRSVMSASTIYQTSVMATPTRFPDSMSLPPPPPVPPATAPLYPPAVHEFGDHRTHEITYRWKATSKFASDFPGEISAIQTDEGHKLVVRSKATVAPPVPVVLEVNPAFRYVNGVSRNSRVRIQHAVGIRLARPWFSSGEGEKLAVICLTPKTPTPAETDPLDRVVSRIGLDPTFLESLNQTAVLLDRNAFVNGAAAQAFPAGTFPGPLAATAIDVIPFDVEFDQDAWYGFVELNELGYRPFVQLALARVQFDALNGLQLSAIAMQPFVPLLPNRTLSWGMGGPFPHEVAIEVTGAFATQQTELRVIVQRMTSSSDRAGELGWEDVVTCRAGKKLGNNGAGVTYSAVVPLHAPISEHRVLILETERRQGDARIDSGGNVLASPIGLDDPAATTATSPIYMDVLNIF